jgi:hypothetical protein
MRWAWQQSLSRQPGEEELNILLTFYEAERLAFSKNPEQAREFLLTKDQVQASSIAEKAAWVSVARVILNLHEGIMRY